MHSDMHVQSRSPIQVAGALPVAVVAGITLLVAVVFLNEANFRRTDPFDSSVDWQTLMKLCICGACGIYGFVYLNTTNLFRIGTTTVWMTLFAVWSLLCVVASINAGYSVASCATLWCLLLFAPAVLANLGPRTIVLTGLVTACVFLLGCWCVNFLDPGLNGFDARTSGETYGNRLAGLVHPNGTARMATLAIALIFVAAKAGYAPWRRLWFPMALAVVTLYFTGSRTWMITAAAIALLSTRQYFAVRNRGVLVCAIVFFSAVAAIYIGNTWSLDTADGTLASVSRKGDAEEIYSFSGRIDLWGFCVEKIKNSPMTGYGYGCQRFVIADEHYWRTRHAHNVLLNVMLGTGLAGGVLLVVVFGRQLISLFAAHNLFPDTILLLVLIGGLTENPLFNPLPGATTLLFLISLYWRDLHREPEDFPVPNRFSIPPTERSG